MARTLIACALLLLTNVAAAGRTVDLIENGIEASLADVTMPSGAAGTVIVDLGCEGCAPLALRASAETRYVVGNATLPHADFMLEVERIRDADVAADAATAVGVYYDRESNRVTRIQVFASND